MNQMDLEKRIEVLEDALSWVKGMTVGESGNDDE